VVPGRPDSPNAKNHPLMKGEGLMKLVTPMLVALALLLIGGVEQARSAPYSFTSYNVPGASNTVITGINNSGEFVGYYNYSPNIDLSTPIYGFVQNGSMLSTIAVPGSFVTEVTGVNNLGQIVGYYTTNNTSAFRQGFVDTNGNITTFGVSGSSFGLAGSLDTQILGINDKGQMVGTFGLPDGSHGFLLSGSTLSVIDPIKSLGIDSSATGINNKGQIVGNYNNGFGFFQGFLLSGGVYSNVNLQARPTQAYGINNAGQIVGTETGLVSGSTFGYVGSGSSFIAVNDQNIFLQEANGINDNGTIVGYNFEGHYTGIIATPSGMTPTPEPSSFILFSIGFVGMAVYGWRRGKRPAA
jgi:uncharacterized membrane protein